MKSKIRVISRAIIIDKDKVLLAKNKNSDFWYAPGGGWEFKDESLKDGLVREVFEETGVNIKNPKIVYVQEFREYSIDTISLEVFWVCELGEGEINFSHIDTDPNSHIEKFDFFSKREVQYLTIYPELLKTDIWDKLKKIDNLEINYLFA